MYKSKKGKTIRTSDDIIDVIILTIVERESSNHQRLRQAIAQSEQLKQTLNALEVMINTLALANSADGDGKAARQVFNATMLKEVVDTMNIVNWRRKELEDKLEQHIQKAKERHNEFIRQMQTLEDMIKHQVRHSETEKVDASFDCQGMLHWHIQMSAGQHKDVVRRMQALEDLVTHQNKRDTEGRVEASPTSNAHHQENLETLKFPPRRDANQKGHPSKKGTGT